MIEQRILVVDDDRYVRRSLHNQLAAGGYAVRVAGNGPDAIVAAAEEEPDLILLELTMPGMSGMDVCRQLREWSTVPIIFLTPADATRADDCLAKPFHHDELLARIRAVLRRRVPPHEERLPRIVYLGGLAIDLVRREVRCGEEEIHLTKTEFDLLREFVVHADKVLPYSHLLNAVWGPGYYNPHLVHVHVSNLCRKLRRGAAGARPILSVSRVGYRLTQVA
jgi:two-component system, OmpR family, KDP operon response regulator KdpE